jgi:hypothetical protein
METSKILKNFTSAMDPNAQLRTMCGSRTGGWSLPGVMSD